MGFDSKLIDLVMNCIELVTYSILVNGRIPQNYFKPSRGIRQGDPLPHYLFNLCVEILSTMIRKVKDDRVITRVPFTRGAVRLSPIFC